MARFLNHLSLILLISAFFNTGFPQDNVGSVTGLPVPRYVVLKSKDINVRVAPGITEQLKFNYKCMLNPVEVTAEFDSWRKIRDSDGNDGWVHEAMLDGRKFVKVNGKNGAKILRLPSTRAKVIAIAEQGVIAKIVDCKDDWCKISLSNSYKGWVQKREIWGVS